MARSIILLWNAAAWFLFSCSTPVEQKPDVKPSVAEKRDTFQAPVQKRFIYVKALSGLRLRKEPDLSSRQLATIPFGTKVQVLDSVSVSQLTVEGQRGKMIEITYENQRGYVFSGFTTATPAAHLRRLKKGRYCFKSYGAPGYEYLAFTIDTMGVLANGSGDGHSASEEASWITSFTGIFEENGTILVKMIVENESGIQAPRLETWEIVDTTSLIVRRPTGKVLKFKKAGCVD